MQRTEEKGKVRDVTSADHESKQAPGRIQRSMGLVEEVYECIRADIMSLKIPPETRISVDRMVRELGVSQTPIREALSMLEARGLVTRKHLLGYFTAPKLNRQQYEKLYEIRLLLEPYAARGAAQNMSPQALTSLNSVALRMAPDPTEITHASYGRFADDDSEFHARIADGSDNELIAESLARLHTHMHIFRLRFHTEVTNEAFAEHARVVRALQEKDADAAEAAMRSHIEKSYERLVQFTEK
jgi:DNA-binding GntR family transcriptional regulator